MIQYNTRMRFYRQIAEMIEEREPVVVLQGSAASIHEIKRDMALIHNLQLRYQTIRTPCKYQNMFDRRGNIVKIPQNTILHKLYLLIPNK